MRKDLATNFYLVSLPTKQLTWSLEEVSYSEGSSALSSISFLFKREEHQVLGLVVIEDKTIPCLLLLICEGSYIKHSLIHEFPAVGRFT